MKWEYKVVSFWTSSFERMNATLTKYAVEFLNEHGRDGWELVAIVSGMGLMFFKRPVTEEKGSDER